MANKVKHNAVLSNTQNNPEDSSVPSIATEHHSDEDKSKLEAYDQAIVETNSLKDSLAKYIEENKDLKKQIDQLMKNNEELTNKLNNISSIDANDAIGNLNKKIEELQQENDSYLMKISDISFDNSKLTSELTELRTQLDQFMKQSNDNSGRTHLKRVNNMYPRSSTNGYSSWN